jgi:hypothetical protein
LGFSWENIGTLFGNPQFIAIFMGKYREILNLLGFVFLMGQSSNEDLK